MKEIILKSKIFKNIEENEVDLLLKCINNYRKTFKKGEVILREGEKTEYMGIVITGSVVVERADLWGNNTVLGVISPGGIFAETYAILNDEPLMINVYANEKSEILFLRTNEIFKTCEKSCNFHDQLILNLIRIASFKNLNLSRKILHTGPKTIRGKLLSFFSEWVKKENSLSFSIPYNRQQLADYLSVDRSAMSNELSKMQKEGILEFKKNKFKIIDKNIIF
ncbi:Crp/Fnr family transcriptional regulator [Peptoniphilus duerdenii]|uniref:Crp/Fnr family transcriptional regulator n=1 Tax=Peptoniphilus duerdenii TaxID=507750 RepID=UPI0028897A53|nr:Crp/Fnr family transcriptional regulator [Peptoniphilus duerdenii]